MRNAILLGIVGAAAVTANAINITSGQYIGSGGPGTGESLAGDRFRSFQPHSGQEENYLGIPGLGTGANRVAQHIAWMADNSLASFDFTFQYDQASDKLVSTIAGGTLEYLDWSTKLAGRTDKTKGAADLNAFQISIGNRDTDSNVYLTGVVLDGIALGGFGGPNPSFLDWLVTGPDMNLTDGFTLTGTLWLKGPFPGGVENSVVNLTAGWDTRGTAPSVPDGGFTLALFGGALMGLVALRRKLA